MAEKSDWVTPIVAWATPVVLCLFLVAGVFLPHRPFSGEKSRRAECATNLMRIGHALAMYHQTEGRFPPSVIEDRDSDNEYSWRVALLPFLGGDRVYDQYQFDEPWNSATNQELGQIGISRYWCPATCGDYLLETNYAMVLPAAGAEGHLPRDTVVVAEVKGVGFAWMEPRDLRIDGMSFIINDPSTDRCIGSWHMGGAHVMRCDAAGNVTVEFLTNDLPPEKVRQWLTGESAK